MGTICDHEFEVRDPKNTSYSLVEYDLAARLGLSLRKNHATGEYEIFVIRTGEVKHHMCTVEGAAAMCNELEEHGCNSLRR